MDSEHPTTFRFIASTSSPDRNGNVLDITGWDLANYRANPVVLFNHNWDLPPVGRTSRLTVEGDRLLAQVEFAPTPLGQELALLNAEDYLRAISVGARPLEWEIRRHPEHGFPIGIHSHRQELLELSIVAVPANPATVRATLAQHGPDAQVPISNLPTEAILSYLANQRPAPSDLPTHARASETASPYPTLPEALAAINAQLRRILHA